MVALREEREDRLEPDGLLFHRVVQGALRNDFDFAVFFGADRVFHGFACDKAEFAKRGTWAEIQNLRTILLVLRSCGKCTAFDDVKRMGEVALQAEIFAFSQNHLTVPLRFGSYCKANK